VLAIRDVLLGFIRFCAATGVFVCADFR